MTARLCDNMEALQHHRPRHDRNDVLATAGTCSGHRPLCDTVNQPVLPGHWSAKVRNNGTERRGLFGMAAGGTGDPLLGRDE